MAFRRAGRAVGVVFGGTTAVVGVTGAAYAYVEPVRNRIRILFLLTFRTPSFSFLSSLNDLAIPIDLNLLAILRVVGIPPGGKLLEHYGTDRCVVSNLQ